MRKYCDIDFEFNETSEKDLNLVCCSYKCSDRETIAEIWLHKEPENYERLAGYLEELKEEGYIFTAHNVVSEARAFISLGLKPETFKWFCTFTEWRMLTNHNPRLQYGEHYIKGKLTKVKRPVPKWEKTEGDSSGGKLTHSLSEVAYKLLGEVIDSERKTNMRDIIIANNPEEIEDNIDEIIEYCTSDIEYLARIRSKMIGWYAVLGIKTPTLLDEILLRGDSMARTAIMESTGYSIDLEKARNFADSVPDILFDIQSDINKQFPDMEVFRKDPKAFRYVRKEAPIFEWIEREGLADKWMLTDKGKFSLSLEAFTKHFNYQHSYPRDNFGAQMVRLLKTKQSLNGFLPPKKDKKSFWDYVGSDGRVRPYLNPYGAQSARYQPSATSFLFLKSAWMRALAVPPKGRMYVGIDYKSEEFLVGGVVAEDKKMIDAYKTGDVYLQFGKDAGGIPEDGTKHSHPKERQAFKSTVLGISYLMSKYGLAIKLTNDVGEYYDEDDAQELIDLFEETYEDFDEMREGIQDHYEEKGLIKIPGGWTMFGGNKNHRSVNNMPIQGVSSDILRKAVQLCQDAGLQVEIPLHDALYIECDLNDWKAVALFSKLMKEAFVFYFTGKQREYAENIMVDIEAWSPELEPDTIEVEGEVVKCEKIHIDERAIDEYENFSKYFTKPDYQLL